MWENFFGRKNGEKEKEKFVSEFISYQKLHFHTPVIHKGGIIWHGSYTKLYRGYILVGTYIFPLHRLWTVTIPWWTSVQSFHGVYIVRDTLHFPASPGNLEISPNIYVLFFHRCSMIPNCLKRNESCPRNWVQNTEFNLGSNTGECLSFQNTWYHFEIYTKVHKQLFVLFTIIFKIWLVNLIFRHNFEHLTLTLTVWNP